MWFSLSLFRATAAVIFVNSASRLSSYITMAKWADAGSHLRVEIHLKGFSFPRRRCQRSAALLFHLARFINIKISHFL